MSTIVDTIANISGLVQRSFSELTKLVLRKTIRPTLNPLGRNTKVVYNAYTGQYERGFVGYDPSDSVNKYLYQMDSSTIGWKGDNLVSFKMSPKTASNPMFNPGQARSPNYPLPVNPIPLSLGGSGLKSTSFRILIEKIAAQSATATIINRKSAYTYMCNMAYSDTFQQLNQIGQDILNQTDPAVSPQDSSRMSTALLRVELFNLERTLADMLSNYPELYASMLDMVRIINSLDSTNTQSIISLIGTLSVVDWSSLSLTQQEIYINRLGQDFITDFNANEMIAILIKSPVPELIITTSYYYSLQKMLYVVFGYNKIIPSLFSTIDPLVNPADLVPSVSIQRYTYNKMGAFITRGTLATSTPQNVGLPSATVYQPDCTPPSQSTYDFIKAFGDLYPLIIQTMGAFDFPTPCQGLLCVNIPANYTDLVDLPQFLLRFAEKAYCTYLSIIDTKLIASSVGVTIDDRIRYLKTV